MFDIDAETMQIGVEAMLRSFEILDTTVPTIASAFELIQTKADWRATLEDAVVIQTALTLNAPVWTFNYRDFAAIKNLEFWTP